MEPKEGPDERLPVEAGPEPGAGDDTPGDLEGILRRLALLTDQVDALQVASERGSRPWWREPSLIISAVALIISVLFSAIGMKQVSAKDLAARQESLRQTVVQIVDSQTEMTDAAQEYSGNPLMARWASGNLNSKRQVQMDTALALVDELGDKVDASTLVPLAVQLQTDGRYEESLSLYFKALSLVESPIVRSAILRSIGWSYRIYGSSMYDVDESRAYMQQAADLFEGEEDDASRFYLADNLLFWAELEWGSGDVEFADSLLRRARDAGEAMAVSNPSRQTVLSQIQQARANQTAAAQTVPDLQGEWTLRFDGDPSRHGAAQFILDQASGTYYVSMLVLLDDVVLENRSGSGTTSGPGTVLIQWQGTRFSEQFQVPVQASGVLELAIQPGSQELSGTDSVVGDPQQGVTLTRLSP